MDILLKAIVNWTKEDYTTAHRELWDAIIREIKTGKIEDIVSIKEKAFKESFPNIPTTTVDSYCFGCIYVRHYSTDLSCEDCLFDIKKNEDRSISCLNGLYHELKTTHNNKLKRIELAERIRDFPIKDRRNDTINLTSTEIECLLKNPDAIEILINHHNIMETEADAMGDCDECVTYHRNRINELEEYKTGLIKKNEY